MTTVLQQQRFRSETVSLTMDEALAWADANLTATQAWLLAEAPEGLIWRPFAGPADRDGLTHCLRLYIFNSAGELRLERPYGSEQGCCRLLLEDAAQAPTYVRFSSYLLADSEERLHYAEHFRPDPGTGALSLAFARFCGVGRSG